MILRHYDGKFLKHHVNKQTISMTHQKINNINFLQQTKNIFNFSNPTNINKPHHSIDYHKAETQLRNYNNPKKPTKRQQQQKSKPKTSSATTDHRDRATDENLHAYLQRENRDPGTAAGARRPGRRPPRGSCPGGVASRPRRGLRTAGSRNVRVLSAAPPWPDCCSERGGGPGAQAPSPLRIERRRADTLVTYLTWPLFVILGGLVQFFDADDVNDLWKICMI